MDGYEDEYVSDSYIGNERHEYLLMSHIYEETEHEMFDVTPQESFQQKQINQCSTDTCKRQDQDNIIDVLKTTKNIHGSANSCASFNQPHSSCNIYS